MGNVNRRMARAKRTLVETVEEITASGTWTVPAGCTSVDAFAVGGGGSGGSASGGGGYTSAVYSIPVTPGEILTVVIGAGGAETGSFPNPSGTTSLSRGGSVLVSAAGGTNTLASGYFRDGFNGGSGGGGGAQATNAGYAGAGGSDSGDGGTATAGQAGRGGKGQGTSTRCPFNGNLYAGGGGGCSWNYGAAAGGAGGGGAGGAAGSPNTGGGGGSNGSTGTAGGSGIIILYYFKYK